jgi:hypothetical protein
MSGLTKIKLCPDSVLINALTAEVDTSRNQFQTKRYLDRCLVFGSESASSASLHQRSIFSRHAGSSSKKPFSSGASRRIAAFHIEGTCR